MPTQIKLSRDLVLSVYDHARLLELTSTEQMSQGRGGNVLLQAGEVSALIESLKVARGMLSGVTEREQRIAGCNWD